MTLLKTGRRVPDALIAVFAPIALGFVLDFFRARPAIFESFRRIITPNKHPRTIAYIRQPQKHYSVVEVYPPDKKTTSRGMLSRMITMKKSWVHPLLNDEGGHANVAPLLATNNDGQSTDKTTIISVAHGFALTHPKYSLSCFWTRWSTESRSKNHYLMNSP